MSEEAENNGGGFFSNLKNQIITGAGVILTTLGTVFIDEVKSLVGIEDEESTEVAAPVQNNQQQQSNNQQVIINIPEQKPVETKTVIIRDTTSTKPVKKKEKEQEIDW